MTAEMIALSILLVGVFLVIAKIIRIKVPIFSKFFLPSSIIAGIIMLLLGPEVLGRIIPNMENGIFNENIVSVLSRLPGLLISVIFASLFIGKKIPSLKNMWFIAGPQAAFGQTIAWGQYVFGILVTLIILTPLFGISPLAGALIEISFEGGHGTSAGLANTFSELGFSEGLDLALGLATVSVIVGVIMGVVLINWAVRKNKTNYLKDSADFSKHQVRGIIKKEYRSSGSTQTTSAESIEPLAFHFGLIAIAILIGKLLLEALIWIESATWGASESVVIMRYIPLFPMAMIGGLILQLIIDKFDKNNVVDRGTISRVQGLSLDFLIVSAIATLSLTVIGSNIGPFIILAITGILWNTIGFLILAPKMIPKDWFERGIGDYGQSMAMTAAGIMLIRIADSNQDTRAMEAFGYKQLMFEPFVGGGVMTAVSMPLIYNFGPVAILIFTLLVMSFWMLIGLLYFGKKDRSKSISTN